MVQEVDTNFQLAVTGFSCHSWLFSKFSIFQKIVPECQFEEEKRGFRALNRVKYIISKLWFSGERAVFRICDHIFRGNYFFTRY